MTPDGRKNRKTTKSTSFRLTPTRYLWVWVLLAVLAFIFTQALRNPVSYSFAVTVALILPIELVYVLLAAPFLKTTFETDGKNAQKNLPFRLVLHFRNLSPLPMPFVTVSYTAENREPSTARASLPPFGRTEVVSEVVFSIRGLRPCRLNSVSVDSILRMFRATFTMGNEGNVLVLPRLVPLEIPEPRTVNRIDVAGMNLSDSDSDEIEEITEYQPGDKLKNVHWKLSGKADDLLVKKYGSKGSSETLIVPDLRRMGRETDEADVTADSVIEIALSAVLDRTERDRVVTLRLPESPDGDTFDVRAEDRDDVDACVPLSAAAPVVENADPYLMFGRRPEGETVFVTPNSDALTVSVINELSVMCPPVTVLYCGNDGGETLRALSDVDVKRFEREDAV